ncbi:hypothetical protein Taro_019356 [Colocasia esculenta]|uniref:Formin-like protein 18 n=1 Tax=Colocasia esculenta TaxID=4460 RepID=A0A843V1Y9_COLES|nr:hypothetical protein [Colocasia esculenta]
MDPCPFVRVLVGNLALRVLRAASKPARSGVYPSSSPCYCKIRVGGQPSQTAPVTLIPTGGASPDDQSLTLAAAFYLSRAQVESLAGKSLFAGGGRPCVTVSVYKGRRGATCGVNSGKLLGRVTVPLDLSGAEARPCVFHSGWVSLGKAKRVKGRPSAEVHLTVLADPDPRFVFEFGGEPERSPQVFQVQGSIRQPVFTCKFACRNSCERSATSRSVQMEMTSSKSWLSSFGPDRERPPKERKGWSVTVHDLSGSPVALASMVTPFVASPGTDRVSRSNPGAWLILRPGDGTWKPWGRLEAWRERGAGRDGLGYRFELLPDAAVCDAAGVVLAESSLSVSKGGQFSIDLTGNASLGRLGSPGGSPRVSGDFGYGLYPFDSHQGFVMAATVKGEKRGSRPSVEVGVQQVRCTEDAAAFVALAAAIDLSMEACRLFSRRLKKELGQPQVSP